MELLIATIGAGKSTYAKKRAKEGAIIVNDDSIVMAVHSDQYNLYQETNKPLYKGIELAIISWAAALNKDVVIDNTNLTIKKRLKYISIAKDLGFDQIDAVVFKFEKPEIHAKRRFESDSRGYSYERWLDVAKKHINIYEPINTTLEKYNYITYMGQL